MRLGSAKGAICVGSYGQHNEVNEMKLNGSVIWPIYSLELSVSSVSIPASGGGYTVEVFGVARNENGDLIRRTQLSYQDVTITKAGSDAIQNNVFTFYAESRGTTYGASALTATYTIGWKGHSATLEVSQAANTRRVTSRKNYFTLKEGTGQTMTFLGGSKYEVNTSAHRYTVGCYYVVDYVYSSGATETETENGSVKSKSGSSGWSYMSGVLSCSANTGTTSRTCTLTAYFPTSVYRDTLIVAQVKPAVIVYDVNYTSATMYQSGGKKVFNFSISFNNNLRGASITFSAIKINNGVTATIKSMTATMSGNSFSVDDNSFAANDATSVGDQYYITFTYDSQTFTSPELENAYYLANARLAYSSGSTISASGSNYAYVIADVMRGGSATETDVICDVSALSATGLYVSNGRVYGSDRATTTGAEISGTITKVVYDQYSLDVNLSVKQEANAVVSTSHSYDYTILGLASPFPSGSQAASRGATGSITYTSCKKYDTPTYTYTSGKSAVQSRTEVGSVTPSYTNTASWITMSGASVTCAKQAKTSTARSATITLKDGSVTIGSVTIYQKATVKTYSLAVSSSASEVGAGDSTTTLYANGTTSYDNGDSVDTTSITSGWSCTNSGSLVANKWSVSGQTATAKSLGTTTTTGYNVGTFSITWNGVAKTISIGQIQNVETEGSTTGVLTMDGNEYTASQTVNVSSSAHSYMLVGSAARHFSYTSGATKTTNVSPSIQVSGTGFSQSANTLDITENTSTSARNGYAKLIYNGTTIITLTIAQAAYVPVDWLTMSAYYVQMGGRKTFTISAGYSDSLRRQSVHFQPYKLNGGVRTDLGGGSTQVMPTSGNTVDLTITVASSTASGDTFRVEATTSRVLADVEATMEEI